MLTFSQPPKDRVWPPLEVFWTKLAGMALVEVANDEAGRLWAGVCRSPLICAYLDMAATYHRAISDVDKMNVR